MTVRIDVDDGSQLYDFEVAPPQPENEPEVVNVSRDSRASIHRRGAISAEVYTLEEVKNYTRKVFDQFASFR